jgi:sugar lactone lactonase YvrE
MGNNTFFNKKDLKHLEKIVSIDSGLTPEDFTKLMLSYTQTIPKDIINIISEYLSIYNFQGIPICEFPISPERPLSAQNHTAYCTVSPSGTIFVSDGSSREIRRFNYYGDVLESFHKTPITYYKVDNSTFITVTCPPIKLLNRYHKPYNISLDNDENLYLTDYYNDIIVRYDKYGDLLSPKTMIGLEKNLCHPCAIFIDKEKQLVYVSSEGKKKDLNHIKVFTLAGALFDNISTYSNTLNISFYKDNMIKLFQSETKNYIEIGFSVISVVTTNTSQIPINEIGNLYIADTINNSIHVYKAYNANHVKTVKLYDSKGKSIKPTTISVDEQGNLIVVSCTENKIFIYR